MFIYVQRGIKRTLHFLRRRMSQLKINKKIETLSYNKKKILMAQHAFNSRAV